MTLEIVLYLLATSGIVSLAAVLADEGLRRSGRPSRWIWPLALSAPLLLLAGAPVVSALGGSGRAVGPPVGLTFELPELLVGTGVVGLAWLDRAALAVWILSALVMAAAVARAYVHLARARRSWEVVEVQGRAVYVSANLGPAIAGLLRPWIILPRWSLALPDAELGFVVLHEEEHVRGGDSTLLAIATALVVVAPWNPFAWFGLRRLKSSMELDCDRRVLRRRPDRGRYGRSLLTVAARAAGPTLGLASFAERPRSLERRIVAMTTEPSRWSSMRALALTALAVLVAAQACAVESPVSEADGEVLESVEIPAPAADQVGVDGPTFTPFTDRPEILNRDEIVAAMIAEYPPLLREAGIGGQVRVYVFIDAQGRIGDVRIDESSGHQALDQAALAVMSTYRFTPARHHDEPVAVWVSFPITFQVD